MESEQDKRSETVEARKEEKKILDEGKTIKMKEG